MSQSINIDRGDFYFCNVVFNIERTLITPGYHAPTHSKCTQVRDRRHAYRRTISQLRIQYARRQMIRRSADSVPSDSRLVMGRLPSSRILLHDLPRPNA